METGLWALVGVMAVIILLLVLKICALQNAAEEIGRAFADRLMTDTNTLIDLSSADRHMRRLAEDINVQLRKLREARHRFEQGDRELKNAVTNISHDLRTPLTAIRIPGPAGSGTEDGESGAVSADHPEQGGASGAADGRTFPLFRHSLR